MRIAIRNVIDLLIMPYRTFMRMIGRSSFDIAQYLLYLCSVLVCIEFRDGPVAVILDMICIGAMNFVVAFLYFEIIKLCGGTLDYWRSFNVLTCIATFANLGGIFETQNRAGSAISFAINIYCIYLYIRAVIVMGGAGLKRTIIVCVAIFIGIVVILAFITTAIAGVLINERGYIG